ncbi:ABC transporter ATP-binding protein [Endozoicomonas arenosclerae]|uniref:ABC transporter ATP-binding protein n=1 Tax=Endozoicomonas arenosclerae TaxID=1633495 RepID=UPI0007834021|nr:ABC transporter ATP-binding protein [Endozoicomonas arenosclerae]
MSFLRVDGLEKKYDDSFVFSHIHFSLEKGEFVTLLGPSGCGKSTLLRCIAGLTQVDDGQLFIDGVNVTDTPARQRGIAMVFQSYALFPNMTVRENIAFGLKMQKVPPSEQSKRVNEAVELVELGGKEQRYPSELSGGQCQRVALARSLVVRPRILLLDEPLSALDARIRKNLREQLRSIQKELGLTTLFVTHDQEEALTLSDRILLMNNGKIIQNGTAEEIYTEPADAFVVRFIGNYNLLSAEQAHQVLGIQSQKQVAIRPESIYVREEGRQYPEHVRHPVRGEVVDYLLLGNVIRYRIKVSNVELLVDLLNRSSERLFPAGANLELLFNTHEIREVDEENSAIG